MQLKRFRNFEIAVADLSGLIMCMSSKLSSRAVRNTWLLTLFTAFTACPLLPAVVVVDMQLDGRVPVAADGNTLITSDTSYSLLTPMLDASLFTSNGAAAPQNATIYGGVVRNGSNDARITLINDNPDNSAVTHDVFRIEAASQSDYDAALVWQKTDFLNGGDSGTVSIEAASTFTLVAEDNAAGNLNTRPDLRWLIIKDGVTYASTIDPGPIGRDYVSLSSGDLTALDWFQVDYGTNFRDPGVAVDESAIGLFDDIDGVGVYFSSLNDGMDTLAMGVSVNAFSADLAVVPEPSASLLVLSGLGLFINRRRRSSARSED